MIQSGMRGLFLKSLLATGLIALFATSALAEQSSSGGTTSGTQLPSRLRIISPENGATSGPSGTSATSGGNLPSGTEAEDESGSSLEAEQLRQWTWITEAEANATDPSFRHWVDLIRTGRADRRIMRLYAYYRQRLDPFDRTIPPQWREIGWSALRDSMRTAEGQRAFSTLHPQAQQPGSSSLNSPISVITPTRGSESETSVGFPASRPMASGCLLVPGRSPDAPPASTVRRISRTSSTRQSRMEASGDPETSAPHGSR
jgi:hypothetical protein